MEVVQRITEPALKTWGEICDYRRKFRPKSPKCDAPVERVPNWEGAGFIEGEGVYKQGLISGTSTPSKEPPPKSNVTRLSLKKIMEDNDE